MPPKPVLDAEPKKLSNANRKSKIGLSEDVTDVFKKRFAELNN